MTRTEYINTLGVEFLFDLYKQTVKHRHYCPCECHCLDEFKYKDYSVREIEIALMDAIKDGDR